MGIRSQGARCGSPSGIIHHAFLRPSLTIAFNSCVWLRVNTLLYAARAVNASKIHIFKMFQSIYYPLTIAFNSCVWLRIKNSGHTFQTQLIGCIRLKYATSTQDIALRPCCVYINRRHTQSKFRSFEHVQNFSANGCVQYIRNMDATGTLCTLHDRNMYATHTLHTQKDRNRHAI